MKNQKGFSLIELLIVIVIIGIIAAIAIPSLLRARVSANEGAIIGDTRSVISAGVAYESASQGNGYPPNLNCLGVPSGGGCIPAYPVAAPTFLDPVLAANANPKQGYVRVYNVTAGAVGTGFDGFCYQGQPQTANRTGVRAFGGDNAGVLGSNIVSATNCCVAGVVVPACPAI